MSTTAPELFTVMSTNWADAVQRWLDQSQAVSTAMSDTLSQSMGQLSRPALWAPDVMAPSPAADQHRHGRGCGHDHDHDHGHRQDRRHGGCCDHDHPGGDSHLGGCSCDEHGRSTGCSCGEHQQSAGCSCFDPCSCCVPDADVVVHARIGERRVVPFRLHNSWRREREVTLGVGPWHLCSGDGLVVVGVLDQEQITLGPCEHRTVRLLIGVTIDQGGDGAGGDGGDPAGQNQGPGSTSKGTAAAKKATAKATASSPADDQLGDGESPYTGSGGSQLTGRDLTGCASAYADIRFEGCARPQRVAVVVSPASCDPVPVHDDCGCCC